MAEIEKLTGHGAPSVLLPGAKGQIYEDLDTGRLYECKGERGFIRVDGDDQDNQFNWVLKGVDISYNDLQDKPEQGSSMGGVSSWNDLTDKPFEAPKAYEFDGNTEGRDSFNDGNANYYKVSDDILTTEQLVGGTLTASPASANAEPIILDILPSDIFEGYGCIATSFWYVVYDYQEMTSSAPSGIVIPSNGIYFAKTDNFVVTKLTTHAKTIDKACLPAIDKADLPAIEVDDLPSIPLSKIKECPVVTFNVSLATFVGDSAPTLNASYDGYTLDELITCIQNGNVIFELNNGVRLFANNVEYNDNHLFIDLLVLYGKKLYYVILTFNKSDGSVFRNNLKTFTAV